MTSTPTRPLNSFEAELLADLREHVAGRVPASAAPPPHRWRRRAVRTGIGAAVVGAAAAVAIGYGGSRSAPAYAVSVGDDGRIHVAVDSLKDAAGLEEALAEQGVTADITYLSPGMVCEQPRITAYHRVKGGHAFAIRTGKNGYDLVLSPRLADPGVTMVVEVTRMSPQGDYIMVAVSVAESQVAPCHEIPPPSPLLRQS